MGKWAQQRKRGSCPSGGTATPPPTDADWVWTFDEEDGEGIASFVGVPPAGAIGWQLYSEDADPPEFYVDQAPTGFTDLFNSGPLPSDEEIFARVRFIISGAGNGDPDTVYSEFSSVKSFHTP
jgi:hypothetical protein